MPGRCDNSFEIRLMNAEGVPVLRVGGTVTRAALDALKYTLDRLASAGHYNVVLNLERAQAANWSFLSALAETVRTIRDHYGAVDLVATQETARALLQTSGVARLFRISRSETQAISRIKRLVRQPDKISNTSARVT